MQLLTLFWSKGEGECGVGSMEVAKPGEEMGEVPKTGDGDTRPEKKQMTKINLQNWN